MSFPLCALPNSALPNSALPDIPAALDFNGLYDDALFLVLAYAAEYAPVLHAVCRRWREVAAALKLGADWAETEEGEAGKADCAALARHGHGSLRRWYEKNLRAHADTSCARPRSSATPTPRARAENWAPPT